MSDIIDYAKMYADYKKTKLTHALHLNRMLLNVQEEPAIR
jgi:hypothetical protein